MVSSPKSNINMVSSRILTFNCGTLHHKLVGSHETSVDLVMPPGVDAPISASSSASDAARFQSFLFRHQYPADCRATVGMQTSLSYFYSIGIGSQMVSMKMNFLQAVLDGKVYHFPKSQYVNPLRCSSKSFDCYFELPTNCSKTDPTQKPTAPPRTIHRKIEASDILWCVDVPRRRLSRLAKLDAVHSTEWYHAQLAAFLFRCSPALPASLPLPPVNGVPCVPHSPFCPTCHTLVFLAFHVQAERGAPPVPCQSRGPIRNSRGSAAQSRAPRAVERELRRDAHPTDR